MTRRMIAQAARGACMGAADVVPGVSGGTVALVLGIYERLVATVHAAARAAGRLLRGDLAGFRAGVRAIDWAFILPLLAGIAAAFLTLARLIEHLLEEHPVGLAATFFGLVAGSAIVAAGHLRRPGPVHVAVALAVAAATFALLGLRSGAVEETTLLVVLGAGALAICAMILPGVSGSFILLMVGMYDYMLDALNGRDLAVVAAFLIGAALGLGLFSSALDWLLRSHHDLMMAALIGLMIGSLRVLWPWPAGSESAALDAPPPGDWLAPLLLALVGAGVVLLVSWIGRPRADAPAAARPAPEA